MTTKAKPKAKPMVKPSPAEKIVAAQKPVAVAKEVTPPSTANETVSNKVEAASPVTKAKSEKPPKKEKPKKVKMVRDSFTMPESDYVKLSELKKKCLEAGVHVKKSELLRAGLLSLSKLTNASLIKAVEQVEIIKTGRPAKV